MNTALKTILMIGLFLAPVFAESAPGNENWFAIGLSSLKSGNYTEALAAFTKVLEAEPDNAIAYNGRGAVNHKMGNYDAAIKDYTRAIALNENYANAYNNRGVAWYQKGDDDRALADYNKALAINTQYVNALSNRGAVWKRLGEYEKAIADFNQALAYKPSYETYNLLAWTLATCPNEQFRNGQQAMDLAQKAVGMKSEIRSLGTLAAAYAEAGQFSKAINTQNRVLDMLKDGGSAIEKMEHRKRLEVYESGMALGKEPKQKQPVEEKKAKVAVAKKAKQAAITAEKKEKVTVAEPKTTPPVPAKPSPNLETSSQPQPLYPFTIQISSYRDGKAAYRAAMQLRAKGDPVFIGVAHIPSKGGDWHRVFFGFYKSYNDAAKAVEELKDRKFRHANIVKKPLAVQIGRFSPDQDLAGVEKDLQAKGYIPYHIPDRENVENQRLLIGAFENQTSAQRQMALLSTDGFTTELVKR